MIACAAAKNMEKQEFLRRFVAQHMGIVPLPPLLRKGLGKPYLQGFEDQELSYSHSGAYLFAATGAQKVGADIELVRPRRMNLPRYALSEQEYDWFCARGSQWEDFYRLWTLKEARVKCTGEGIRALVREISVPLLSGGSAAHEGFRFASYAFDGYIAALCVLGADALPEEIHFYEGREEEP